MTENHQKSLPNDEDFLPKENFVIEAKGLRKMYGPHLALDDVNLSIPSGAIGILGPNGAGKSTLFKCLLGLIGTTSGEGTVLGYDIKTEGEKIRSRIAVSYTHLTLPTTPYV